MVGVTLPLIVIYRGTDRQRSGRRLAHRPLPYPGIECDLRALTQQLERSGIGQMQRAYARLLTSHRC